MIHVRGSHPDTLSRLRGNLLKGDWYACFSDSGMAETMGGLRIEA